MVLTCLHQGDFGVKTCSNHETNLSSRISGMVLKKGNPSKIDRTFLVPCWFSDGFLFVSLSVSFVFVFPMMPKYKVSKSRVADVFFLIFCLRMSTLLSYILIFCELPGCDCNSNIKMTDAWVYYVLK